MLYRVTSNSRISEMHTLLFLLPPMQTPERLAYNHKVITGYLNIQNATFSPSLIKVIVVVRRAVL